MKLRGLPLPAEVGLFALLALALTLLGNALHPKGLKLGNDYFPASGTGAAAAEAAGGEGAVPLHDFETIDGEELLGVAEFATGERPDIVILDARSAGAYATGHLPGAFQVDPYQDEPLSALADQLERDDWAWVVVYCRGGDCEDSLNLAHHLVYRKGLQKDLVRVYEGGLLDWTERGGPLVSGPERDGPAVDLEMWRDPEADAESETASGEPMLLALPLLLLLAAGAHPRLRGRMVPVLRWAAALVLALYAGAKLGMPVDFLKAVHGYGVLPTDPPWLLNLAGAGVPWMEAAAALCLLIGLWARGAATVVAAFLAVFTLAVLVRAGAEAGSGFLTYAFDCGCGTGLVVVWQKVLSNLVLLAVLLLILRRPSHAGLRDAQR